MSLTLKRVSVIPQGAFGVLLWHGIPFAVSIEKTYDTQRGAQVVKIPPGVYKCTRGRFNKGGYDTFEIAVPGHTEIKFHVANTEADVDGCIGVAEMFGVLNGQTAVMQSGAGFRDFMSLTADVDEFQLAVLNV